MIEYTNYIDNKGMIGIIRRTCNYVDDRLVDHGFRVACMVRKSISKNVLQRKLRKCGIKNVWRRKG